jgi:hypothetical protein
MARASAQSASSVNESIVLRAQCDGALHVHSCRLYTLLRAADDREAAREIATRAITDEAVWHSVSVASLPCFSARARGH